MILICLSVQSGCVKSLRGLRLLWVGWCARGCPCLSRSATRVGYRGRRHDGDGVPVGGKFAVRPLGLWRPSTRAWRQQNVGSWLRASADVGRGAHEDDSCGRERLVAEVFEGVVAAFEEVARDREAGAVVPESLRGLAVVGVVGGAGLTRGLGCLVERPAQDRWSLAGEVAGRAAAVGGVHGDVQAAVAHGVPGGGKPAAVAELGEDRDRGHDPDLVAAHQRPTAGLASRVGAQWLVDRGDLSVERADHCKGDRDLLARRRGRWKLCSSQSRPAAVSRSRSLRRGTPWW